LIFKMSVGYVKSNLELQNFRLWQVILNFSALLCLPHEGIIH